MMSEASSCVTLEETAPVASQRRRRDAGFSLTELLAVIIIMLLVSVIMANGIPAARVAYNRVVDAANAHVLMATTITRLRDELASADLSSQPNSLSSEEDGAHQLVSYLSMQTGYKTTLSWNDSMGIFKTEAAAGDEYSDPVGATGTPLVQPTVGIGATESMHVEAGSITYDKGMFTVSNLKVMKGANEISSVGIDKLEVRVLSPA